MTFMRCAADTLREPILYLSLYFKTHRKEYYDLLQRVREEGDWEAWVVLAGSYARELIHSLPGTASSRLFV